MAKVAGEDRLRSVVRWRVRPSLAVSFVFLSEREVGGPSSAPLTTFHDSVLWRDDSVLWRDDSVLWRDDSVLWRDDSVLLLGRGLPWF